ncbi:MAG TPA: malectin domain-containing carbohydrate-binding protein [Bryobacteraceae bacterium]|nr:malectin domain-containing carbohydrate-binding protein [Bryobacteraceae bacterium]
MNEAPLAFGVEAQRAALETVLRSRTFSKNPRLSALLEYLCVRSFEGAAESIKEYSIATDVFGRPSNFDQSQDAIVRVEMHRLRKKLSEFYATEGEREPIEIVIHSGRYLPDFVARQVSDVLSPEPPPEPQPASPPLQHTQRFRVWTAVWLLVAALTVTLAIVAVLWPKRTLNPLPPAAVQNTIKLPAAGTPPSDAIRILCGSSKSSYRDREGNIWASDAFYSGGSAVALSPEPVYRTRDSSLFRTMRTGDFSYKIPLRPGVYELRLYFLDSWYNPGLGLEGGEGTRVFQVSMNNDPLLRDFDVFADAGPNTADVRVFKDVRPQSDGYLHLAFAGTQGAALLNAIEIVPGIPHRLRPIRLITQDSALTDRAGVTWYPDNYFLYGRTIARSLTVTGTEDPEIYARERYGNFSYAIPVSEGHYRVALHFSESYWGPNAPGGGGPGTRVFDVYCNGVALLRNFDMLKEAAPRTQIVKTFHNLQPNAQGKLLLSFIPVKNYANLSAIEVADESDTRQ